MKRQTAVDWLVKEFSLENFTATIDFVKQKEKEQIEIAFDLGRDEVTSEFIIDGEDYYNKSFNQNK
jgi:hypothetical protein